MDAQCYVPVRDDHPNVLAHPAWADAVHVDPDVLRARTTWRDGVLVTLAAAGIRFDAQGKPRNPHVHTGRKGRGALGKWGVNHAADPIVTRGGGGTPDTRRQVLVVYRGDQEGLVPALPGGMVDVLPDGTLETFTRTCQRELCEEAVDDTAREAARAVQDALAAGTVVHTGYVADPRTTDHAWIESCAIHAHLDDATARALQLRTEGTADGECKGARWLDAEAALDGMYANHATLVRHALDALQAAEKASAAEKAWCLVYRVNAAYVGAALACAAALLAVGVAAAWA